MWIYVYVGALAFNILTAKGASFTINDENSAWKDSPCKPATPRLKYSIENGWEVDELQLQIPPDGLWIGYVYGAVAFDYLGCSSNCTEHSTDVKSIGDCHLICKGAFGIQKAESTDTVRCCCAYNTESLLLQSCDNQCGDESAFLCGKKDTHTNSFSIYNITNVAASNSNIENGTCLEFNYPNFTWASCRGSVKRLLCSEFEDGQRLAKVHTPEKFDDSWVKANQQCLLNNTYTATVDSVRTSMNNGKFNDNDKQVHWTAVIRTHAMLYAKNKDLIKSSSIKFAVINRDRSISYEVDGCRRSLCESDDTSTYTTSTTSGFATNACTHGGTSQNGSSTNAIGLGIGLAVGLLCAVGAVVVIIVLRKRCGFLCRLGSNNDKTNSESRDFACKSNAIYVDEIQKHNYFILEKCAQSVGKSEDHKNTAYEPNKGNAETDNYNLIDETDESDQSMKDKNDYTTNALRTGPNSRKPANVYNTVKLDLPGNYAHVGSLEHDISKAGSDYDTTAVARRNDGDEDYNHIPHPESTTCARRNGSKDDYDVINGKKITFPPSDSADYAHVKI